ncbi:MAG: hypothetical protein IKL91_05575 [Bacteroidales bacterium]|nr:hypothetical protein [Bacteroidales bacterium]
MKRIIILLLASMPVITWAQDFKPLEAVEVPDFPTNNITVDENEYMGGGTYYTAHHLLAQRSMNAYLGVPASFDISYKVKNVTIPERTTAKLLVGGEEYYMRVDFVYNGSVSIPINGQHIKHIAVSGLQGIVYIDNGDIIYKQDFNAIEQELWRRTADELIKTVEKFKILDY